MSHGLSLNVPHLPYIPLPCPALPVIRCPIPISHCSSDVLGQSVAVLDMYGIPPSLSDYVIVFVYLHYIVL